MGSTLYSKREVRRHNVEPGRKRRNRPKSFPSREAAEKYAKEKGLRGEVRLLMSGRKYVIVN